ncbi:hypothetical protein [Intestinimonas butyriciproducens]|uniref:hypothetical protein n=1 Tax=Intestinimonas butyriciproducens TaxID=1297617 RepID=UPI004025C135
MKRNQIALVCGLALIGALAGCSKNETPKVTPTPTTAPTATVAPEPTHAPTTEPVNPTDSPHRPLRRQCRRAGERRNHQS